LERYESIFVGRVRAAPKAPEPGPGYRERLAAAEAAIAALTTDREVRFDVRRSWKGDRAEVAVRTPAQRSACGYPFEEGREYLVYASRGQDGALWVTACDRTRPIEDAQGDLDALDARAASLARGAAPARAGCAGCSVAPEAASPYASALLIALAAWRRRRRS
jgi:MYXO-CTERM domain-containing protein